MDVLDRLDEARAAIDVLEHPFYRRWSAGELSAEELAFYAGQYRHAVVALAEASRVAAESATDAGVRAGLQRHAEEEAAHVELWDRFARACTASAPDARFEIGEGGANATPQDTADATPQTDSCARAWTAGGDLLEHLAVLYALEASQPAIAQTKLEGLQEHYGYSPEGPATEYFRLHRALDVEHARQARELIERLMSDEEDPAGAAERMLATARGALRGNWQLLDGVEAARIG